MSAADAAATHVAKLGSAGLGCRPNGQVVLSGPLARLAKDCDRAFTVLADAWRADSEEHPAMIDLAGLQQIDYLTSFPHLATFPVSLDPEEVNLKEFTARDPLDATGAVRLTGIAPVHDVLTPAACYHVYLHHRGAALDAVRHITTRNTCFRRETHYQPLRRQWSFQMREIVCLGTRVEVSDFLARTGTAVDALCRALELPVTWEVATDPFFQPARNPKYLAQRVQPTKHEVVFGGDLAIASTNRHEDHFGSAFDITREGRPASSGCVAFGLERWLYALTRHHGTDPANWPDVTQAADRIAGAIAVTP